MNFILPPPSLEHRALVKIAVTLWSLGDVRFWKLKSYVAREDRWKEEEIIILNKVSKLQIPTTLKEKLLDIIGPVGLQILSWMEIEGSVTKLPSTTKLPSILVWTPHGTIDSKRTAEVLVKDETLHVEARFALACCYCLVDDIIDLRKKCLPFSSTLLNDFKISFWCTYLEQNDDVHRMQTIVDNFEMFVKFGNEFSTRYFCHELRFENTGQLRVKVAKDLAERAHTINLGSAFDRYSGHFCALLSTMNAEQQLEIFRRHTYSVVKSFLVWPRQSHFLEMAKATWSFLSKEHYYILLYNMVDGMSWQRKYLGEIFKELWLQTPEDYKQIFTNGHDNGGLLLALCEKGDEKNFQLILKNFSILVKGEIIFSGIGIEICIELASSRMWNSIEYLIQECIPSPEERITFKDNLKNIYKMNFI